MECKELFSSIRQFCSQDIRNVFFKLLFKTKMLNNMLKEIKPLPDSTNKPHEFLIYKRCSLKKKISLRDQRCGFSHSRVSCGKRFITVKNGIEKASDTDIRRGQGGPQSLVWVGLYTIFQLVTNNRKVLPDPLPQHSFQDNRISQKYFLSPPARYIVVI